MLFKHFSLLTICNCLPAAVQAQALYNKSCPLLGLVNPGPPSYASNAIVQAAMENLQANMADSLNNTSLYGKFDHTTTAFSVDLYSLHDQDSLFTYHYTPDALRSQHTVGVRSVDSNSIYRIGSVSKLYTVYLYLVAAGDLTWNQPITNYVPEIAAYVKKNKGINTEDSVNIVDWESITIGSLASQMAGLPRDAAYSGLLEHALGSFGVPLPPAYMNSTCGDDARLRLPCNRTDFFNAYLLQHPIVAPFETPVYSNAAYQILAYAIENITGTTMANVFETVLVDKLGLNSTFYTVPPTTNSSFIPVNATVSWWNADARDEAPAGGYYSSINDMRIIGKAMLNSTLLSPAQTRRWMKPHSFTSNVNYSVGAPWEILRAPGDPVSWIYTKSGDLGAYAAMVALFPEYNIGFTVLAAGFDPINTVRVMSDMITATTVPALQSVKKASAASTYAGTYSDASTNSSLTLTATDNAGLIITDWRFKGYEVLPLLGTLLGVNQTTQDLTGTLYYTGLAGSSSNGTVTSWRALYEVRPQPEDTGAFSSNCDSWVAVNAYTYGGVGLDEFLFTLDASGSFAMSLQPRVLEMHLSNTTAGLNQDMRVPKRMHRMKS